MRIRAFKAEDAAALASLFQAAVQQVGSRYYLPEQIDVWSNSVLEPEVYVKRATERIFLVAVNNADQPIGYGDLEHNGHIDHLYCHPDVMGTGVGSSLLATLENEAKILSLNLLSVEASEYACSFFQNHGFKLDCRNDFLLKGVAIYNYSMSKGF